MRDSFRQLCRRARKPATLKSRLALEALESRDVPATFTVTNTDDSGGGSLRDAVMQANNTNGVDTILFDLNSSTSQTITLTAEISITDSVSINGPGPADLTIDGNGNRIFTMTGGTTTSLNVSISGLTLINGEADQGGAIFSSDANLMLTQMEIDNNEAVEGGALYATGGSVTIKQSSFVLNFVQASSSSTATPTGDAIALVDTDATIENSTFALNGNSMTPGSDVAAISFDGGTLDLLNDTIARNHGVGLEVVSGTATIQNSLLVENSGDDLVVSGGTVTGVNNIIDEQSGTGTPLPSITKGNKDSRLGVLIVDQDSGLKVIIPLASSPAINAVDASTAPAVDERGMSRPVGKRADLGAVEVQPPEQAPGQQVKLVMEQLNALVIANLRQIFSQPLPRNIAVALISQIADTNGDGFADVTVLIGLRSGKKKKGGGAIQLFSITFDGISTSGALIGQPILIGKI